MSTPSSLPTKLGQRPLRESNGAPWQAASSDCKWPGPGLNTPLLYIHPSTWGQGVYIGVGKDRSPHAPQNGPKDLSQPTASLSGDAIIHSFLHACIHSSSSRLPALCGELPSELTDQQQGPETALLSKRTIGKGAFVERMRWS